MAATSTISPLQPSTLRDALDAVQAWEEILRSELIERDDEIHLFALALAAREHLFLLGKPGVAKSMCIDRGVAYIGGVRYFKAQFSELSTPEEMFGPWSMQAMMKDRFERVTRYQDDNGDWHESNWAQNCQIDLADEFYKASESLANTALLMTNERQLNDNGVIIPVPLCTFVVCSNEERKSDGTEAFDDRIMLRHVVDRVRDRANVIRMLQLPEPNPNPTPVISWDEWNVVQAAVDAMPVAPDVYEMIATIEHDLLSAGVEITPRRLRKGVRFVKAEALLEGAAQAETEHVAVLEHCAWLKIADQQRAQQIVLTHAAPVQQLGLELLSAIEAVGVEVDAMLDQAAKDKVEPDTNAASSHQASLKQLNKKISRLQAEGGSSKRARDLVGRCKQRQNDIAMRLLTEAFDISADAVQAMLAKERD